MTTESSVGLAPDGAGKKVDTTEVTTGAGTVERQGVCVGDPEVGGARCAVRQDGAQQPGDFALAVHVRSLLDAVLSLTYPLSMISRALATAVDAATGRLRALVDLNGGTVTTVTTLTTCTTVTTVTTCSTVTNVSQLGGADARLALLYSNERASWALNVGSRIT